MSWAEIKKAVNSDINTSLDKLVTSGLVKVAYGVKSAPSLEVTGKGVLDYIWVRFNNIASNTQTPFLKITVDGQTICNYSVKNINTGFNNMQTVMGFLSFEPVYNNDAGFSFGGFSYPDNNAGITQVDMYTYMAHAEMTETATIINQGGSNASYQMRPNIITSNGPIRFNNSLKIEVSGAWTYGNFEFWSAKYELYE